VIPLVKDDRSGFSNSAVVPQWWFERVKNVTSQCSSELRSLRGNPNALELNCFSNWLPKQGYHITTNPVYVLTSEKSNRFLIDESHKHLLDFLSPDVKFFRSITGSNHSAFYNWHVEFPKSVARNIDRHFSMFSCLMGHLLMIKNAYDNKHKTVVFFEDDVELGLWPPVGY